MSDATPAVEPRCSVTVAIVAIVGGDTLRQCLDATPSGGDELLVVTRTRADAAVAAAAGWRCIEGHRSSVPQRRAAALAAARCEVVCLLEDTCVADDSWLEAVRAAFVDTRVAAVAGPVAINPDLPGSSIALACAEYGRYHPRLFRAAPDAAQAFPGLPGNNLAFRRASVNLLELAPEGLVEGEVAARLTARGARLVFEPRAAVTYRFADPHGARLATRFNHGRLYAGRRARAGGLGVRLAGLLKTPLLPLVLSARAIATLRALELRNARSGALAWILLQETAWSAGELAGYLSGTGRALAAWR